MGSLPPEALLQAYINIGSFNPKWTEMLYNAQDRPEIQYQEFVEQLQVAQPNKQFKVLKDIPKSVLTDVNQLDRSCFSKFDKPVLIEFALRFANDASFDKLVTVPTNTTVAQMRSYIYHRIVDQLYTKAESCKSVREALPQGGNRPTSPSQIVVYWTNRSNNTKTEVVSEERELVLEDENDQLQELISSKCWRVDNLTPGLDLIENFWNLALLENNYELIREKLYFKFA